MVVDTAEERCSGILANVLCEQMAATRMFVHEVRDIVNEASDDDQWSPLGLLQDCKQPSQKGMTKQ